MRNLKWAVTVAVSLGLVSPAFADDRTADAKDTATETKSDVKKKARDLKPGEKTAEDRKEDAKDTAAAHKAKAKKKARHAKRTVQKKADEATK